MDGSLTGASESDVDKQQLTARVPLNGCPRGLTPNFSAAMEDCNLDAVKRPSCRIYHTPKTGRVVGLPLSKYSRAQHRTLLSAFQRRAAPRSMAFTKVTTQAAHLCESRRPGAAASRFWAAAGVSSGLVDGVKAPCPISKLPEIEARTVVVLLCAVCCVLEWTDTRDVRHGDTHDAEIACRDCERTRREITHPSSAQASSGIALPHIAIGD